MFEYLSDVLGVIIDIVTEAIPKVIGYIVSYFDYAMNYSYFPILGVVLILLGIKAIKNFF